ncbi:hypothetical protein [Empedobacter brevis]|uniref:hypothetical protein n=1 Tax=Empedobacter brevis TaxID=247 RepID=UPI0039B1244B
MKDGNHYWILIGEKGKVIEINNDLFEGRVLVLFDKNLDELKLNNHNPIKNSLWILETDLIIYEMENKKEP